jgi:hypothetical protein
VYSKPLSNAVSIVLMEINDYYLPNAETSITRRVPDM